MTVDELVIKIAGNAKDLEQAMKKSKRDIKSVGDEAKKTGKKTKQGLDKAEKSGKSLSKSLMNLKTAMAGVAVLAGTKMVTNMVRWAAEEEGVMRVTTSLMKTHGEAFENMEKDIDKHMKSLEKLTAYNDTDLQKAFNSLLAAGMSYTDALKSMNSVTSMAFSLNRDLGGMALLVGKAYNGQTGELSRYGIVLDEGLDKTEKFNALLDYTSENFSDASERTKTLEGQMSKLNNEWHNLGEEFGARIIPEVLPAMKAINEQLRQMRPDEVEKMRKEYINFLKEEGAVGDSFFDKYLEFEKKAVGLLVKTTPVGMGWETLKEFKEQYSKAQDWLYERKTAKIPVSLKIEFIKEKYGEGFLDYVKRSTEDMANVTGERLIELYDMYGYWKKGIHGTADEINALNDAAKDNYHIIDDQGVAMYRTAQAYNEFGGAIDDLKGQLEGLNEEMQKNREEMEEIEEAARRRGEATEEEQGKLDGLTDAEKKLQKQIRNTRREIDSMRLLERQGSRLSEEQKNKLNALERQYDVLTYQLDDNRYSYEELSDQIRERGELTDDEKASLKELKTRERDLNDQLKDKKRNYDSATDAMERALGKNKTYLDMADDLMKTLQDEGYNLGEVAKAANLAADARERLNRARSAPSSGGSGSGGSSGGGDLNLFPDLPPWVNPPPESEPPPSPIKQGGGSNNPNPRGSVWNPIKMAEGGGPIPYDDFPALLHRGEVVLNTEHLKVLNNALTQPRHIPREIEGSIYHEVNVDTRGLEQSIDKLSSEIEQMKASPQINNEIRTEISFPNAIIKEEADLEQLFSHDVFDRLFDKINREIGNRSSAVRGGWV